MAKNDEHDKNPSSDANVGRGVQIESRQNEERNRMRSTSKNKDWSYLGD
jgi:hypothetical protein